MNAVVKIERLGLRKYDAMQKAIVEAVAVDEVKNIRDQVQALEKYAAQARNFDAERRCAQLRIQAELKGGLLYKASVKANGQESGAGRKSKLSGSRLKPLNHPKTLEQLGISKTQSHRWQQLAENPKAVEQYLREEEDVPTTAGALAAATGKTPLNVPYVPDYTRMALRIEGFIDDLNKCEFPDDSAAFGSLRTATRDNIDSLIPKLKKLRSIL